MAAQTFAQRPVQNTPKMREAFYRAQDEEYERIAYKARRAVRKAKALTREAEEFLSRTKDV